MAEDGENPFEESNAEGGEAKPSIVKLGIRLGLMAAVLGIGSVAGYGLGGLLGGSAPADPNAAGDEDSVSPDVAAPPLPSVGPLHDEEYEYFSEFESVTVNLNEARMARFLKVTIVLAFKKADAEEGIKQVKKKQLELQNWLNISLAKKTLEEVRGKNHTRIQRDICDAFNEMLWPGKRPLINHVLFKQFNVQ